MIARFTSHVTRLGSFLRPDELVITDSSIMHNRRNTNLLTETSESIPRDKIAGVKLHHNIIGTELHIYGFSANTFIRCEGFDKTEAKIIQGIIANNWYDFTDQEILEFYNKRKDLDVIREELIKRGLFIEDIFTFY